MRVIKEALDVLDFNYCLSYHLLLGSPETLKEFLEENVIYFAEKVGNIEKYSSEDYAELYVMAEIKAQVQEQTISEFTKQVRSDTNDYLIRYSKEFPKTISMVITERAVDLLLRLVTLYVGKGAKPCRYDAMVFQSFYSLVGQIYQKGSREMHTDEIMNSIYNKISDMLSNLEQ